MTLNIIAASFKHFIYDSVNNLTCNSVISSGEEKKKTSWNTFKFKSKPETSASITGYSISKGNERTRSTAHFQ